MTSKTEKPARKFTPRGRQAVKLLGVLRGAGALVDGRRRTAVTYQIDVYRGGPYVNGAGVLYGPVRPARRAEGDPLASLVLEGGGEVSLIIVGQDEDGVDVETRGPIPGY